VLHLVHLELFKKEILVLNAIQLAKHAQQVILAFVHHALLHINYGKEDVYLNVLKVLTQLDLVIVLHAK
jgi:hypothetical protein